MSDTKSQTDLLKWILEDIRKETLKGIEHLTKEQLFQPPIESESFIGSYLMHFAECDIINCVWSVWSVLSVLSGLKEY